MDLVALEDLRRLKYRYLRALDLKQWDEFATTLTADATAHYGDRLSFTGRDEIVHYMSQTVGPGIITVHHCHHPEIEVDGDRATGRWALEDTVIITDHQAVLHGAAFYEDRYVRTDDEGCRSSTPGTSGSTRPWSRWPTCPASGSLPTASH